jgi:AbiV family abortive infection protein
LRAGCRLAGYRIRRPSTNFTRQTSVVAQQHSLPDNLSPAQVIALQDALLANADRLLRAAITLLDGNSVPLAQSLAILGMEESGKAIALHERRVAMSDAPEGEPFVDERLRRLWREHSAKLETVHEFLTQEEYWFGAEPADPGENALVLGTIEAWKRDHNVIKQRGFYVDISPAGDPITPEDVADPGAVRAVIGHVHQIAWQLRLGEHIEGKRQLERQRSVPPATVKEIEDMRLAMSDVDPEITANTIESMRTGREGLPLNNASYAFILPINPFENVGRPGYEAMDRELWALVDSDAHSTPDEGGLTNK